LENLAKINLLFANKYSTEQLLQVLAENDFDSSRSIDYILSGKADTWTTVGAK